MSRQLENPHSITPAIIPVMLSSDPLSSEKQERVCQDIQELKQRWQHHQDEIRKQATLNNESDDVNRIT